MKPAVLQNVFAVMLVGPVVAGLKRMSIVPSSERPVGGTGQSTLGFPKYSVTPPNGVFGRHGLSMFGPQLQIGSVMQCEPMLQSASELQRLRTPGPLPAALPEQNPPHTGQGCCVEPPWYVSEFWRRRTELSPVARFVVPTTSSVN